MKEQIITKKTSPQDTKQKRRIEALRANLRKRKAQIRMRQKSQPESALDTLAIQDQNQQNLSTLSQESLD